MLNSYSFSGLSIISQDGFIQNSSIKIRNNRIAGIGGQKADYNIDFNNRYYLYPGIINVHDHLRGNYLPKVGPKNGNFYLNWSVWDYDLQHSKVRDEREKNTVQDLYLLSAYKNLFSGAITVNDHFPHAENEKYISVLPIRIITNYTLEHSCASFSLKWGDGIETEHKRAVEKNFPFIIHCEEGFDRETQNSLVKLEKMGCLDDHNVLIHCIGFSNSDIRKVSRAGASIVWCPGSNMYMFNVTCKIREILKAGINVSIGTDATHSGSANIIDEMQFARKTYRKIYSEDLDAKTIFDMVTINPARAFRIQDDLGSIAPDKRADFLVLKPRRRDPYEAFVNMRMQDIELLVLDGKPIYGMSAYKDFFEKNGSGFTRTRANKKEIYVKGDPAGLMKRIWKATGKKKHLKFIPLDL
ncbi:MAG: amidohydrolase family protein [Spirochaetales bacterium]|nr:amidohydrolase family protein [Spirochaetales bacterium]